MFVLLTCDDGYRTHVVTHDEEAVRFFCESGYESYRDGHDVTVRFQSEVEATKTLAEAETRFG